MYKFPEISQFRNVIRNVKQRASYNGKDDRGEPMYRDTTGKLPVLKFRATTKLHGSCAGIVYDFSTQEFSYQSRERVLTLQQDNAGFMLYMSSKTKILEELVHNVADLYIHSMIFAKVPEKIVIYGEWCGGSVQKGVALNQLPKMFVIFGAKFVYEDETADWIDLELIKKIEYPDDKIYNILTFGVWYFDIDFNYPELVQNEIIKLTEAIENECPCGKYFGVTGVGEGLVASCITEGWRSSDFTFKSKGEKHSVSKVKTLAAVDVEAIQNLKTFVDSVVTDARLEWALSNMINEQLKPFEMPSMGDFIRTVYGDVIKEEMDTIVENQIDPKKVGSLVANKARPWYIQKYNEGI